MLHIRMLFLSILLIVTLFGCNNDDSSESSKTSSLDMQLQSVIQKHELTGDPSTGRDIPDIDSPLAQLGKKLFFSKSLGGDTDTACVSCHHPVLGGGDGLSLSIGTGAELPDQLGPGRTHSSVAPNFDGGPTIPRNAPTTFNCAMWDQTMFHDGRVESLGKTFKANGNDKIGIRTPDSEFGISDQFAGTDLPEAQLRFPVTSPEEMLGFNFESGNSNSNNDIRNALANRLDSQSIPNSWLIEFQQALNSNDNTIITFDNIGKAISSYERSQVFVNNSWKQYVKGDDNAISYDAKQGALLFFQSIEQGGANCVDCHKGDFFTDEQFYVLAIPQIGRGNGDGDTENNDFGRFRETGNSQDKYAFRTPSLLNIEVTGPYGHSGAYSDLEDVIHHNINVEEAINNYDFTLSKLDFGIQRENAEQNTRDAFKQLQINRKNGIKSIQNIDLNDKQISYLKEFLLSLTDPCVKDRNCLESWIADINEVGPDSLQLNAVDKQNTAL